MNRKLLTHTLTLPFLALAVASACSLDETDPGGTGGTGPLGGSAGATATGGSAGSAVTGGSAGSAVGGSGGGSAPVGGKAGAGPVGGTGGMAGTGGGMGACADPDCLAGTKNEHGFAWKDSYFLVACTSVSGHDCLTVPGNCPNQDAQNFEDKGSTFAEEFQLGGEEGKMYTVTIKVNGVVEGKYYNGGMRRDGANFADANDAMGSDGWHVGGAPQPSSYNVFKITVFQPDGTTELQHYYLNSYPSNSGFESHQTVLIGYEATFDVPGKGVIRYLNQDSNCRAINNCGPGDITNQGCPAPRMVPNEPGLAVPATYGSKPVDASFNQINQAQQPFHAQMVHVTVTKVEPKP